MRHPYRLVLAVGLMTVAAIATLATNHALSESPTSTGTDVTLEIQRVSVPPEHEGAVPQYLCSARVLRLDTGEVLVNPRIQTQQGLPASVGTTTQSGVHVDLKVLVFSPLKLTYDVQVTSPNSAMEHHRGTISFLG